MGCLCEYFGENWLFKQDDRVLRCSEWPYISILATGGPSSSDFLLPLDASLTATPSRKFFWVEFRPNKIAGLTGVIYSWHEGLSLFAGPDNWQAIKTQVSGGDLDSHKDRVNVVGI